MKNPPSSVTRRTFVRQAACAAVGLTGVMGALHQLRLLGAATALQSDMLKPGDFKALVCVFLYGGNDANNLLIPYTQADYDSYAKARQVLAIPREQLLPVTARTSDGHAYAFHPSCPELQQLFNAGRLAVLANVGTLVAPVTVDDFRKHSASLPPDLFSHESQQVLWQTSVASGAESRTGWGGRMADLLQALNANARVSTSISLAGTNKFQAGRSVFQYDVQPGGKITGINPRSGPAGGTLLDFQEALLKLPHKNVFEAEYAGITQRAIDNDRFLSQAIAGLPNLATVFPRSRLADQLSTVARLVSLREKLGMRRQIYFCAVGGYDTHSGQMGNQAGLFKELSQAFAAFQAATTELGVAENVTAFTASDFGRTFTTNGGGSDHGWGSHHLIMGGAVKGGDVYGKMPALVVNGPDDTGRGRWIPTVSVDQYSATLANWFGVSASDIPLVLPNIGRFASRDIGFMG